MGKSSYDDKIIIRTVLYEYLSFVGFNYLKLAETRPMPDVPMSDDLCLTEVPVIKKLVN